MVKFNKFSILIYPTICLLVSSMVNGQYGPYGPRPPYQMPMAFSPYHPARINQETLPISQAEFAQLVAESMATSRGPHHHHPPNTDQDYEGPEHWAKEGASHHHPQHVQQPRSMHEHHHQGHDHHHASASHHYQQPFNGPHHQPNQHHQQMMDYHNSAPSVAAHYTQQYPQQPQPNHHYGRHQGHHPHHNVVNIQPSSPPTIASASVSMDQYREAQASHYQPEERIPDLGITDIAEYPRAPVFETGYTGPAEASHLRPPNDDESETPDAHIYGGRPTQDDMVNLVVDYQRQNPNQHHPSQAHQLQHGQHGHHQHHHQSSPYESQPMEHGVSHHYPGQHHHHQPQHFHPQSMAQPLQGPNDPPPLSYHQDFSRQYHHAQRSRGRVPYHQMSYHPGAHHRHHPSAGGQAAAAAHVIASRSPYDMSYNQHHHQQPTMSDDPYMAASASDQTDSIVLLAAPTNNQQQTKNN